MPKKVLLALCVGLFCLPGTASAAVAPDTAASPPDTAASVNATPNGVWPTTALARANGSDAVAASANGHGCPASYGCGWVNSRYGTPMGKWFGNNKHLSAFGRPECRDGNWNDCISSIDNNGTSGCNLNWTWDSNFGGRIWSERVGYSHATLGDWNDNFSSNFWCSHS